MTVLVPSSNLPATVVEGLMEQIMTANRMRQQKGSSLKVGLMPHRLTHALVIAPELCSD